MNKLARKPRDYCIFINRECYGKAISVHPLSILSFMSEEGHGMSQDSRYVDGIQIFYLPKASLRCYRWSISFDFCIQVSTINVSVSGNIYGSHIEFTQQFFFLWLYSPWRTLAASHVGGFLNCLRHMVGLLGRVISPSQGLYLHRTTQQRKTRDKHPCLERDSNPRSQQPTGQDLRLRPHGHWDRPYTTNC
jgi:hypothetical protein